MPIYTFECQKCKQAVEVICAYGQRDARWTHDEADCGGELERTEGVETPTIGKPSFQTHAIMESGAKVAGHFGKFARKKGGWHRP